jgi:predicted nucleic acid-binding protein
MKSFDILVDSDAFIALIVYHDAHFQRAHHSMERFGQEEKRLVTTDLVVAETASTLSRRFNYALACQFIDFIRHGQVPVIFLNEDLQRRSHDLFLAEKREQTSAVDCANIAVAAYYAMDHLFSFDGIYARHGFTLVG